MNNEDRQFQMISLDQILQPARPIRMLFNEKELDELAASIMEVGILQPILLNQLSDNRYEIIAGHRRYLAAQRTELLKAPAIIMHVDDTKLDTMKVHENLYRTDVNPLEEGYFFKELKARKELTNDEIGKMISRSEGYVRQRIDSTEWPEDLRQKVITEQLNFSQAREIAAIKSEATQKVITNWATEGGASTSVISKWRQEYDPKPTEEGELAPMLPPTQPEDIPEARIRCDSCHIWVNFTQSVTFRLCPACAQIATGEILPEAPLETKNTAATGTTIEGGSHGDTYPANEGGTHAGEIPAEETR